jgi:hypothetical protein
MTPSSGALDRSAASTAIHVDHCPFQSDSQGLFLFILFQRPQWLSSIRHAAIYSRSSYCWFFQLPRIHSSYSYCGIDRQSNQIVVAVFCALRLPHFKKSTPVVVPVATGLSFLSSTGADFLHSGFAIISWWRRTLTPVMSSPHRGCPPVGLICTSLCCGIQVEPTPVIQVHPPATPPCGRLQWQHCFFVSSMPETPPCIRSSSSSRCRRPLGDTSMHS